jgi:hypothetical protein
MRAVTTVLLLVVLITTVGCSALMHTRVSYPDPGVDAKCDNDPPGWTTVKGALSCAAVVRNDLDSRADLQSAIPRYLGAALIPLSAAIAGLAMTGTTGAPITALTLGGVAAMGEGFWLSSTGRRQAYSIGASAVQCVITTTRPLAFRDDTTPTGFGDFQTKVRDLPTNILEVNRRISALNALAPSALPDVQAAILDEIAVARQAVSTANGLVATARALIARMNGAPEEIHGSVDHIIRLVNEEIDKLEPTMDAVRQAITQQNQLRTSAFAGLDELVKESEKRAAEAEAKKNVKRSAAGVHALAVAASPVEQARDALLAAVRDLNAAMAPISRVVDSIGNPPPARGCLTTVEGTIGAGVLTITLSSEEPVLPGQTFVFLVSGGVGDVQIKADPDSQAALEIQQSTVGAFKQVAVKVKSDAKPNTYLVDVTDKVNSKVVKIVVKTASLTISGTDADTEKLAASGVAPTPFFRTAIGGTGNCEASLDPPAGFLKPETSVSGGTCTIVIVWAATPPTANQVFTLNVKWGQSGARKFKVTAN